MTNSVSRDGFTAQLGAFSRIFSSGSADELADRFMAAGLTQMQFNFSALGYPQIPDQSMMGEMDVVAIADALTSRGVRLWGISGTWNMAHPDPNVRDESTRMAVAYIQALKPMGAEAVTLCTGTRDPDNMWRRHPDNASEEAWRDFRRSLDALLPVAAEANLLLAIEPEPGNVITGTRQAMRLIDELGPDADRIGFILDAANIVADAPREEHDAILREAFGELGERTLCLHGKDTRGWQDAVRGRGGVDYTLVMGLCRTLPRAVPFIIQDASEQQLPAVRDYILRCFEAGT